MRRVTATIGMAMVIIAASLPAGRIAWASDDLGQGAALYAEHCASCHGENLEGAPNWRRVGEDGLYPAPPLSTTHC